MESDCGVKRSGDACSVSMTWWEAGVDEKRGGWVGVPGGGGVEKSVTSSVSAGRAVTVTSFCSKEEMKLLRS